jgi:predicted acylesterase/phospholipase RssA
MSNEETIATHPFNRIALSLSGGGVRAVGFHLGTLDYLNHTNLLKNVHTLSSVSGGSLVAIGYALSLKQEHSFDDFYDDICEYLPELNTMEELLENLRDKKPSVASGSRTLITSLAQVYREKYFLRYFDDPPFGDFWKEKPEIHLKEIIFNATEFKTGFAFRFQKSEFDCLIGNGEIWLDEKYAKHIRMSDIMAASSCIPGGMEPMMFPQDFHWPNDQWRPRGKTTRPFCDDIEADLHQYFGVTSIPLMDGGVYDNQGISSIMLAIARQFRGNNTDTDDDFSEGLAGIEPSRPLNWARWFLNTMEGASKVKNKKDLGNVNLFIVSDTPTRKDPMYVADPNTYQSRKGLKGFIQRMNLGTVSDIGWGITALLMISVLASLRLFLDEIGVLSSDEIVAKFSFDIAGMLFVLSPFLSLIVPALLVIITILVLVGIRMVGNRIAESALEGMPPMRRSLWYYAKKVKLGELWEMITLRAGSLSALASRIYMNRIRQLGYTLLYSHDEFEKRVMDNDINTLVVKRQSEIPEAIQVSDKVKKVVERAATMRTKLWIDQPEGERDDLEVMIAAGQITTCFNIIKYLWLHHRDEDKNLREEVLPLFEQAESDWQNFALDPFLFVDERNKAGRKRGAFWNRPGAYPKKRWYLPKRRKRKVATSKK